MRSKHLARLLGAFATAIAAVAMVAPVAEAETPAMGYTQFAGCPTLEEKSTAEFCIHSVIQSGHFQMGSKDVPIEHPIPLTGGVNSELENFVATSEGGLKPVKQTVPGGVVGITGLTFLLELLGSEALTLYAVTEAVGTPTLSLTSISLPIKVHLVNAVLGKNCYVGSASKPINLNLTTGMTEPPPPNESISGQEGTISIDGLEIIHVDDSIFVDNSFSAPGASGCVLTLLGFLPVSLNGLVNAQAGLPAAAGTNETIQNIDAEFADNTLVYP
jgi:hypothetical protein